jgi:hypothetical protein
MGFNSAFKGLRRRMSALGCSAIEKEEEERGKKKKEKKKQKQ